MGSIGSDLGVSRAQKISTVVDLPVFWCAFEVSRAQKISTVVDFVWRYDLRKVSRAQKISTVVDIVGQFPIWLFHALKKFLLL